MKLFVLADLHLGADCSEWGRHASHRQEDLRNAWDEAVHLADTENVDAFLVAGDLFTRSEPDAPDTKAVRDGLERLTGKGTPVILLPGIYDGPFTKSAFYNGDFSEGVTVVTWPRTRCVEIPVGDRKLFVHARAPLPGFESEPAVIEDRLGNEGIHVGLAYRMPGAVVAMAADRSLEGLNVLVQGGSRDTARSARDGVPVISPGSPVGLSLVETGTRAWTVIEIGEGDVEVHHRDSDIPRIQELDLNVGAEGISDAGDLASHLRETLDHCSFLALRITGEVPETWNESKLNEALEGLPFAVRWTDTTTIDVSGSVGDGTIADRFCRELDSRRDEMDAEDGTLYDRALRLGLKELRRREERHAD